MTGRFSVAPGATTMIGWVGHLCNVYYENAVLAGILFIVSGATEWHEGLTLLMIGKSIGRRRENQAGRGRNGSLRGQNGSLGIGNQRDQRGRAGSARYVRSGSWASTNEAGVKRRWSEDDIQLLRAHLGGRGTRSWWYVGVSSAMQEPRRAALCRSSPSGAGCSESRRDQGSERSPSSQSRISGKATDQPRRPA